MAIDLNKMSDDFLKTPAGGKLAEKKSELGMLINSPEGKKVKDMLSGDEQNVMAAIENGDMAALQKNALEHSKDGGRLAPG